MNIVFDLDGTLIDSAPDIHHAVNAALVGAGLTALPFAQVRTFIGNGAPVLVERCLAALNADPAMQAQVLQGFLDGYSENHAKTVLYPHVFEVLESLQAAGHALALCTNKPTRATHGALAHFDLTRFFPVVVGGDTLPRRKPDAAPLLHALAQLPAAPALFVGDSEVDAATAKAANIPFALYTEGYRKTPAEDMNAQNIFNDFRQLLAIVDAST
ncbi:phosphoglycolate phosphatase [Neogemmobacter tilapiae]|uniref:Phosphoglycolate phosphatase n=1 Tax=Neogemmobacter tilapiae TaxID=875041 RepID=A0A918WHI3_9RHOB|nr:phosphoglycolate phosphatase [Gemmobacter tilapiae]GHC44498.1 phosphoglycolate phosphatase [Gemmobacter tilapiae]